MQVPGLYVISHLNTGAKPIPCWPCSTGRLSSPVTLLWASRKTFAHVHLAVPSAGLFFQMASTQGKCRGRQTLPSLPFVIWSTVWVYWGTGRCHKAKDQVFCIFCIRKHSSVKSLPTAHSTLLFSSLPPFSATESRVTAVLEPPSICVCMPFFSPHQESWYHILPFLTGALIWKPFVSALKTSLSDFTSSKYIYISLFLVDIKSNLVIFPNLED